MPLMIETGPHFFTMVCTLQTEDGYTITTFEWIEGNTAEEAVNAYCAAHPEFDRDSIQFVFAGKCYQHQWE